MTLENGEPEIVVVEGRSPLTIKIEYKQLDPETREKHIRALVRALARQAAWNDHVAAMKATDEEK